MKELMTRPFFKEHSIVEEPGLIKVKTIKAKYLDQLPTLKDKQLLGVLEILGAVRSVWIVVRHSTQPEEELDKADQDYPDQDYFAKLHTTDYMSYIINVTDWTGATYQERAMIAQRKVEEIPQIFED